MPLSEPTVHDLLVFHYECLQGMYFSEYHRMEGGALLFSESISDPYYNFFSPETSTADLVPPAAVLDEFVARGREPAVYLTPLAGLSDDATEPVGEVWAHDAWLVGDARELAEADQAVEGLRTALIDAELRDGYIVAFAAAYSGEDPDDPYGQLDPAYTKSLHESFDVEVPGYNKYYLLATLEDTPVGVAAMFTSGDLAGVYGVGTVPAHRRAGIGHAMMSHLARIALEDEITHIMLQTEAGSGVQRWYEKLGYRHSFTARYVRIAGDVG